MPPDHPRREESFQLGPVESYRFCGGRVWRPAVLVKDNQVVFIREDHLRLGGGSTIG